MVEFDLRPTRDPRPARERAELLAAPGFGRVFTDHMVTMRWTGESGWHDARLEPYGPFPIYPATSVLHYGQEIFEGMKAYRHEDGSVALFRPERNAARFNASARRMAMPEIPEELFLEAVELLVRQDREWVPAGVGKSLYLRPMMIATDHGLGFTQPSDGYLFCVLASPAIAYFGDGPIRPLTVWISEDYTRAAPGGTGAAKAGGNYGGAFAAGREASAHGCDQVVWLDSAEHRWVEEMGGMNVFFVYDRPGEAPHLVTPALTGALLPGVTRDSLLKLAPEFGFTAAEGRISTAQWRAECGSGVLSEVFACGTAAVIAPVGTVKSAAGGWGIGDGRPGRVTSRLREELLGIQHGTRPDPFGWIHRVG
jgi:branched-chain amino acid aminotransferase